MKLQDLPWLRPVHRRRLDRFAGAMHRIADGLVLKGRITGQCLGDRPDLDPSANSRRTLHPAMPPHAHLAVERAASRLVRRTRETTAR